MTGSITLLLTASLDCLLSMPNCRMLDAMSPEGSSQAEEPKPPRGETADDARCDVRPPRLASHRSPDQEEGSGDTASPKSPRDRSRRSRLRLGGPDTLPPGTPTLRSLKGQIVVVECKSCRLYGEMDRKDVARKFKASVTVSRLRKTMVGACERMCADGIDRCGARITSRPR